MYIYLSFFIFILFSFKVNGYELITSKSVTQETSTKKVIIGARNFQKKKNLRRKYANLSSCHKNNTYDAFINETGYLYGVDPYFIKAIIASESCFKVDAVSHKGAEGLMQLMPFTARRFGVIDSFNAKQNIVGGVKYLKFLQNRFKYKYELIAASYNAGEGAVDKYRGIPPYKETVNYVRKVMSIYNQKNTFKKEGKDSLIGIPNNIPNSCHTNFNKKRYTYVEVNGTTVRGFFNGSNSDNLLKVSRKTGIPLKVIKRLNKKNTEVQQQGLLGKTKILLWHCDIK
ncbi:transglycosylase-like protein with SLT domain [Cocleimonas flava]|uniref:Transglycosylase-like protein with SLT domain n=1 Tax=Cocleimonas flava TaxID=634765 RepID=A0A4R1F2N1_9GAMM|nr:transglycosylase-like protein with SLT domain [Cocleimonas flava]